MTAADRYALPVRQIHWLMAAALLLQWASGEWDDWLGEPFHFSFGVIVLLLALVRITARLLSRAPAPLPGPALMNRLAQAVHLGFYVVMLALPMSGIVWRQARGKVIDVFGLFDLPNFIAADRALARQMHDVHEVLATAFLVLLGLHVLGVIKRQWMDRQSVLQRMGF